MMSLISVIERMFSSSLSSMKADPCFTFVNSLIMSTFHLSSFLISQNLNFLLMSLAFNFRMSSDPVSVKICLMFWPVTDITFFLHNWNRNWTMNLSLLTRDCTKVTYLENNMFLAWVPPSFSTKYLWLSHGRSHVNLVATNQFFCLFLSSFFLHSLEVGTFHMHKGNLSSKTLFEYVREASTLRTVPWLFSSRMIQGD